MNSRTSTKRRLWWMGESARLASIGGEPIVLVSARGVGGLPATGVKRDLFFCSGTVSGRGVDGLPWML